MVDTSAQVDLANLTVVVKDLQVGATVAGGGQGTAVTSTNLSALTATPGTAAASKAVVLDSGTKISGIKNITLAAGTATVAPLNFTSGTKLTTAAAGAVEYDGVAYYASAVASSRQQVDAEQYIVATANSTTYNAAGLDATTTPAALFTSVTNSGISTGALTVSASFVYFFEFLYNLTNTGTTAHTWATLFGGTATFSAGTNYQVFGNSSGTANGAATGGLSGFTTAPGTAVVCTPSSTSATEQVSIEGYGTLVVNAGGTFIPQMQASSRPGASGTPGVTFLAGSWFRIWALGSANFVGNWA